MSSETSPVPSIRGIASAFLWFSTVATAACLPAAVASSCRRSCGDVEIPYPFGMEDDQPGCAIPGFEVTCNITGDGGQRKPSFGNVVEILGVLLAESQVRIKMDISSSCYNTTNKTMDDRNWTLSFMETPYRLSDTGNKFTVIGCRTLAYIGASKQDQLGSSLTTGCVATCGQEDLASLTVGTCSGIGCCQTTIPKGLQNYEVSFDSRFNTSEIYNMSRCSYAALVEDSSFTFSTSYALSSLFNDTNGGQAPLLLDWSVGNETCEAARRNPNPTPKYACISTNSECFNSSNGPGYICKCKEGFHGNPYLDDLELRCKDINECTDRSKYPCAVPGTCINTPGGFKCVCPPGYPKGNAQNGTCERDHQPLSSGGKIAIGISAFAFLALASFLAREVIQHKRSIRRQNLQRQTDEYFQQHGGQLLLEMMKVEGNVGFTLFDRVKIETATGNFNKTHIVGEGGQGTVYKAVLDGVAVAIKRCKEIDDSMKMEFVQELVILCRVNHPNIVKLLGCCLQFEAPMLVYEFVQNKTLQELLDLQRSRRFHVTLGTRLRIAAEAAEALAHLHCLPHPILHGDVKPANILLAEGLIAKVSDFGCSTIDENTQAVPKGTPGYIDPDYLLEYQLTSKNDVYSFGVILLEFLTGKKPLSKERRSLTSLFQEAMADDTLRDLLDSDIVDEASMMVIYRVAMLASQCLAVPGTTRPTMMLVATELRWLALDDEVQRCPQSPLMLEDLSFMDTGSTVSIWYNESQTSGVYSLKNKAVLSTEFAR